MSRIAAQDDGEYLACLILTRRPGEGRDPYTAADVVEGTRRTSIARQAAFGVMGPGLRRDDGECVARSVSHTSTFSRHDCPSLDCRFRPLLNRGRRESRVPIAPMGPEQWGRKLGGRTTGVTGAIRLSLRDGLRLIRALPGETGLCCHRLRDAHLRNPKRHLPLGRQACTTSPSASCAFVDCAIRVHRISTRVRDDREAPLVSGETGKFIH
ncbi:hypothetical protein ACVIW0_006905 [Bradyrhizobium sp. USDA 4454]